MAIEHRLTFPIIHLNRWFDISGRFSRRFGSHVTDSLRLCATVESTQVELSDGGQLNSMLRPAGLIGEWNLF